MSRTARASLALIALAGLPAAARADHFDDHQLPALQGAGGRGDARKATRVSLTDLAGMPKVVQGAPQSVLFVVRTDERNWSKLLVRGGGIRRQGAPSPRPFLHVERLVTYSADPKRGVLADKRDVYLFDGFALDLDLGQVVKKGDGDDLSFEAAPAVEQAAKGVAMMDGDARRLGPLLGQVAAGAGVELIIPATPLVPPSRPTVRGKTTGAVTAADLVGKYRLDVDGRFTGVLNLRVEEGRLAGDFVSDQTGAVYKAAGSVGMPAHHLTLSVSFPRTDLKLDGRLFTRGRSKIAGSATMEENVFGFVAERAD